MEGQALCSTSVPGKDREGRPPSSRWPPAVFHVSLDGGVSQELGTGRVVWDLTAWPWLLAPGRERSA